MYEKIKIFFIFDYKICNTVEFISKKIDSIIGERLDIHRRITHQCTILFIRNFIQRLFLKVS